MPKLFLFVGLGGALGSMLRYLTQVLFSRWNINAFPYATLTVNIAGCFLIGLLMQIPVKITWLNNDMKVFLITGFCGGLTTFSTFAYENIRMLQEGNTTGFITYSLVSYSSGLIAVVAGMALGKMLY